MIRPRLSLLVAAGGLAAGAAAISLGRPITARPVASVLAAGPRASAPAPIASLWRTHVDTVRRGELLVAVLERAGLSSDEAKRALRSASSIDSRRVRAGTMVMAKTHADSGAVEIVLQLASDRRVRLLRADSAWSEREEKLEWTKDTVVVAGIVRSTLVDALTRGSAAFPASMRAEIAYELADILEYKIDLSRDVHAGDTVRVLVERERTTSGLVRTGNILAVRLAQASRRVEAVRFAAGRNERPTYLDGDGKTMRAAFLRAPLAFRRISSVFGRRKHPILGVWRAHNGMDYAASAGTPVRALGNGTVIFAGWKGGYGQVVEIRHRNGYVTRYGHLKGFAKGIRRGASVDIARTIGYVGATGLATAPHLHFEVLVGGVHRDPRVALRNVTGEPLSGSQRAMFASRKAALFAMLDRDADAAPRVASAAGTLVERNSRTDE